MATDPDIAQLDKCECGCFRVDHRPDGTCGLCPCPGFHGPEDIGMEAGAGQ